MPDDSAAFHRLGSIIRRLRAPDGCAWDRQQSPRSLRAALMEEAWECVSAIDDADDSNLQEELGDLYLLATMISWMKEEEGVFTVESVLTRISDKLVRRHPHVFGRSSAGSVAQVLVQWEQIKSQEKADRLASENAAGEGGGRSRPPHPSALEGVPTSFPPLERAAKLQKKASRVGFDWPGPRPVWDKIGEELDELRVAAASGSAELIEGELGDLLFSVVNLARLLGADPAVSLHRTNRKFERRFREVERRLAAQGVLPTDAGLQRMDALWNQVKSEEGPAEVPESSSASQNEAK